MTKTETGRSWLQWNIIIILWDPSSNLPTLRVLAVLIWEIKSVTSSPEVLFPALFTVQRLPSSRSDSLSYQGDWQRGKERESENDREDAGRREWRHKQKTTDGGRKRGRVRRRDMGRKLIKCRHACVLNSGGLFILRSRCTFISLSLSIPPSPSSLF